MFRFTIRDFFWLLLLAGVLFAWLREGLNLDAEKRFLDSQLRSVSSMRELEQKATRTSNPFFVADGWSTLAEPDQYEIRVDTAVRYSGEQSAMLRSTTDSPSNFAYLSQSIAANRYRSQRVRLSGQLKGQDTNVALLAVAIDWDSARGYRIYQEHPLLRKTADWTLHELVLDVPPDAKVITFGVVAQGGTAWADDLQFEIVGMDVPVTRPMRRGPILQTPKAPRNIRYPNKPRSLDFELAD